MTRIECFRAIVLCWAEYFRSDEFESRMAELEDEPEFDAAFGRFVDFVQAANIMLADKPH
jgi:hypothetical protein